VAADKTAPVSDCKEFMPEVAEYLIPAENLYKIYYVNEVLM
jgi:hypothetical protein